MPEAYEEKGPTNVENDVKVRKKGPVKHKMKGIARNVRRANKDLNLASS